MSLAVNTNVSSLTAHRSLAKNETMMSQAMTRLSTGLKINSASDDAAGLAIAERMTSQIKGINMAVKNANDGIGLTKSIEGALVEVTDMLQRLRELSVQSANDTNGTQDRIYIQEEVQLLLSELNRVSSNTRYNGIKVLDGNFSARNIQVGTEGGEVITFSTDSVASGSLGSNKVSGTGMDLANVIAHGSLAANLNTASEVLTIQGFKGTSTFTPGAAALDAKGTAVGINSYTSNTGVTAEAKTNLTMYTTANATSTFTISGTSTGNFDWTATDVTGAVKAINDIYQYTGVSAKSFASGTKILLTDADGDDITVQNDNGIGTVHAQLANHAGTAVRGTDRTFAATGAANAIRATGTIEAYSNEGFTIGVAGGAHATKSYFVAASTTATLDATSSVNLKTQAGATSAIRVIDGAIEKVSSMRAELGAIENRLSHTVNNLMNVSEQTENSRSLLQDANFAVESSNLSKAQVLMQAATAMLAQANARPQLALQLLQG